MRKGIIALAVLALFLAAGAAFAADVKEVYSENGMVSSAHELASKAGVEILQKGGNAIDAAIATMLALNVVEPNASGIGGGGFSTIRFAKTGEVVELDYREVAPLSSTKDMYASEESKKAKESVLGGKAVGVPGIVKGIFTALEKYGTMSFAEVAAPAIRLAEEGFEVHPMQTQIITDEFGKLSKYSPDSVFLPGGLPAETGSILKQPELAKAFRLLASDGPDAFYNGPIGEALVAAVNNSGGKMSMEDLKGYKMIVQKPVHGTYRGYSTIPLPRHPAAYPYRPASQHHGELPREGHEAQFPGLSSPSRRGHEDGLCRPAEIHGRHTASLLNCFPSRGPPRTQGIREVTRRKRSGLYDVMKDSPRPGDSLGLYNDIRCLYQGPSPWRRRVNQQHFHQPFSVVDSQGNIRRLHDLGELLPHSDPA